jgi:hypothetical protein
MPDFGIFRGFNEKLFGDKLYAGQLPTQLGIIGSQEVFNIDADALLFFARVTAAGGTLSATEESAINTLIGEIKTLGIWTKMKAIYPMVGASAAACAQNLKSSSFTGVFNGGWTFTSTGAEPNGTSAYMDTGFNQSANLTNDNMHFSYYTNSGTFAQLTGMGGLTTAPSNTYFLRFNNQQLANQSDNNFTGPIISTLGFYNVNRTSTTLRKLFFNGLSIGSVTTAAAPVANSTYYLGAINPGVNYGNFKCAFSSIGEGLTDAEADDFYSAVQAFQETLNREV